MENIRNLSAKGILHHIIHSRFMSIDIDTIVITGKNGPTGKTWLRGELNARGYNVVEITEAIYPLVNYSDDDNHVIVDESQHLCLVVLNHRLPMKFL